MSQTGWIVIFLFSVSSILVSGSLTRTLSAETAGKLIPVRIGTVSKSTLDLPFFVARDRGFFREEGLEAEIILMRSNLTLQAMVARSIDFGTECRLADYSVRGRGFLVLFRRVSSSRDLRTRVAAGTIALRDDHS